MTISGPDVSGYQRGLRITPGTAFVIAKATEGTYYRDGSYLDFKNQTIRIGGTFSGYHFLKQEGSATAQAQAYYNFAGKTPCMMDIESEGSSHPGPTEWLSFADTLKSLGGRVWGAYIPRWYHQQIGSPDLRPLAQRKIALVSSAYDYVGGDQGPGWNGYGGMDVSMWQYTDRFRYNGYSVDFNAYKGSAADFAAMVNGGGSTPPVPGEPVVSLSLVLQSERADIPAPSGHTTNYNNVIWLERALEGEGLLAAAYVDGSFGTKTKDAYTAWQQRLGYSGADADGVPGLTSLSKLGAAHGFLVTA